MLHDAMADTMSWHHTEESRHFKKRKGVKPRYKEVDVPSSNMPSLEDAAADRSRPVSTKLGLCGARS